MKSLPVCLLVLCSAISIDAGLFFRRTGRNSPPLSSYGAGQVGVVSSSVGSAGSGAASGGAGYSAGGVAAAVAGHAAPIIAILSETNNAPGTLGDNGNFDTTFESENGIKQQAVGSTVSIGEESVVTMKGSYEYVGPDGQTYVVDWIADENGFQPSAPHLPKDVPIPFPEIAEAVEAQIAFAAQEDAAGGSAAKGGSAGGFDGSVATAGTGGFGGQSFGASGSNPSLAPLSSYGRQ
ncbi:unnamed protein product [Lepeophtheirus salmonis]|uniref:(salmon louse) hypothetical protein n=1 Tax=Lepeophtheirus salmonis TaxID=72036 RepID=A0A7R8CQA1_LEPSM|nr:unnamed protein product [Lepeophtheirus salmonis]CAF2860164.1 unnamed protein product [Lepeophtheirus salmonis]